MNRLVISDKDIPPKSFEHERTVLRLLHFSAILDWNYLEKVSVTRLPTTVGGQDIHLRGICKCLSQQSQKCARKWSISLTLPELLVVLTFSFTINKTF